METKQRVCIIGLGIVGSATFEDMSKAIQSRSLPYFLSGVDLKDEVLAKYRQQYGEVDYQFSKTIPVADIYIISVLLTEQVEQVVRGIPYERQPGSPAPLVIVESTFLPASVAVVKGICNERNLLLATFPHRYNPNDPKHRVFNLNRLLGGIDKPSTKRAYQFYCDFMSKGHIIVTDDMMIATLSKVAENAYRFMQIAIAEELKMECDKHNLDFDKLRKATNSKWNIKIMEARDGIDGICLPKDIGLMNKFFPEGRLIRTAIEVDEEYRLYLKKKVSDASFDNIG